MISFIITYIVRVLHGRGCGFVKYRNEANAQFAKEAMGSQSLDEGETLNVRWATEDPNPKAIVEERKRVLDTGTEGVTKKLAMDTELIHATRQIEALQNGLPPPPPIEQISDKPVNENEIEDEDKTINQNQQQKPQETQSNNKLLSGSSIQALKNLAQVQVTKPTSVPINKPNGGLSGLSGYGSDSD